MFSQNRIKKLRACVQIGLRLVLLIVLARIIPVLISLYFSNLAAYFATQTCLLDHHVLERVTRVTVTLGCTIMHLLHTIPEADELEESGRRDDTCGLGQEEPSRPPSQVVRTSQRLSSPEGPESSSAFSGEQESPGRSQRHSSHLSSPGSAMVALKAQMQPSNQYSEGTFTLRRSRRSQGTPSSSTAQRSMSQVPGPVKRTRYGLKRRPPVPQWLLSLMFDIEDASKHELTVE